MLDDPELKRLILDLLKTPSQRTKQRRIGASTIGDPCDYCLAHSMLGNGQRQSKYWLGAKIGDAIHKLLEEEGSKHVQKAQSYHFKALEGADLEQKIYLGEIPGYGDIYSTPDLYLASEHHLVDYKTSKRTKVNEYVITGQVPGRYQYQAQLYARALIALGKPVEKISFVFINRDGTSDQDVAVLSYPVEDYLAEAAMQRATLIWQWLEDGNDPETLPSDPNCFYCNVVTHRM